MIKEKRINDSDSDLDDFSDDSKILDKRANHIGWVIIKLNSLEELVSCCICESLGSGDGHDELHYTCFLSEMSYTGKVNTLIRLYRLYIVNVFEKTKKINSLKLLDNLEYSLRQAGEIRNRYAHADWESISKKHFVKIKTKVKRDGVFHAYKKFNLADMKKDIKFIKKTLETLENFDETYINQY